MFLRGGPWVRRASFRSSRLSRHHSCFQFFSLISKLRDVVPVLGHLVLDSLSSAVVACLIFFDGTADLTRLTLGQSCTLLL